LRSVRKNPLLRLGGGGGGDEAVLGTGVTGGGGGGVRGASFGAMVEDATVSGTGGGLDDAAVRVSEAGMAAGVDEAIEGLVLSA
jgi:hypothetical protein